MNQKKIEGSLILVGNACRGITKASNGDPEFLLLVQELLSISNKIRALAGIAQKLEVIEVVVKKPAVLTPPVHDQSYEEKLTSKLEEIRVARERREQLGREALKELGQAESNRR